MLFNSENNCHNSNIETIIKDKITSINNNYNNNNNNLINFNLNNNTNLNQRLTSKLDKLNNFKNNQNGFYLQHQLWPNSYCGTDSCSSSFPISPGERENVEELLQYKNLDNDINNQNQKLVNCLANINEEQENKNNVLLSLIDLELLSKNTNNLLIENSINVSNDSLIDSSVSISPLVTSEQNMVNEDAMLLNSALCSPEGTNNNELLLLNSAIFSPESTNDNEVLLLNSSACSPESISDNELLYTSNINSNYEIMSLENILNNSPNGYLATTTNTLIPYISTPESSVLSSPESNILSSPELCDNFNVGYQELNLNDNSLILNNSTLSNYLINQEIIKLQQKNLLNNNLIENIANQIKVSSDTIFDNNIMVSTNGNTSKLFNQPLEIPELTAINLEKETKNEKETNLKRKLELEENEEDDLKSNKKRSNNGSIINEGKPFIYVITASDDEDENNKSTSSEDDGQKKKKYKKKYYVCSVCNYKSKRHYNVEVHLKIHEKNRPRPFECEICKKAFCRLHDLERHKVVHQEKMFSCELCGKKFGRLDSLKRHIGCKTCAKRQQSINNEL